MGCSQQCQIWAGCQVSALICDCSVNFSHTAGPWQPLCVCACMHTCVCVHQHARLCVCWCRKTLLQTSGCLYTTGKISLLLQLKFLQLKHDLSSLFCPIRFCFVQSSATIFHHPVFAAFALLGEKELHKDRISKLLK